MDPKEAARSRGHTLAIEATCSEHDLYGWVAPTAELDARFRMTCEDTGELLLVNGWLFSVTVCDAPGHGSTPVSTAL